MLGCTSENCEKRLNCKRYYINLPNDERNTLEYLDSFASGSCTTNESTIDYWCGPLGNYKMYIEVEENDSLCTK